jgi:hypothetical protein
VKNGEKEIVNKLLLWKEKNVEIDKEQSLLNFKMVQNWIENKKAFLFNDEGTLSLQNAEKENNKKRFNTEKPEPNKLSTLNSYVNYGTTK